jgi:hypothetical protein
MAAVERIPSKHDLEFAAIPLQSLSSPRSQRFDAYLPKTR